jgi:hypothetical protein
LIFVFLRRILRPSCSFNLCSDLILHRYYLYVVLLSHWHLRLKAPLPGKIQSVALSSDSAAYIDSDGRLFHVRTHSPQETGIGAVQLAPDAKFTQVALGTDGFLVALAKNGYIYYRSSEDQPLQKMDSGDIRRKTVTKVSAGDRHAAVICSDGSAWAFGDNYLGAAGQPYSEKTRVISQPSQIKFEDGKDGFVDVACGKSHTVAVTKSGRVVSMGLNRYCQTGHRHTFAESSDIQPMAPPYILFGETRQTMQQNVQHRKQFMQEMRKDDPTVLSLYQPKAIKFFDDQKVRCMKFWDFALPFTKFENILPDSSKESCLRRRLYRRGRKRWKRFQFWPRRHVGPRKRPIEAH